MSIVEKQLSLSLIFCTWNQPQVQFIALAAIVFVSASATYGIPLKRIPKTKEQFMKMKEWRENVNRQIKIGAAPGESLVADDLFSTAGRFRGATPLPSSGGFKGPDPHIHNH
jgi:hypothetical protein